MVFIAAFWCDGACRNNGQVNKNKPVIGGAGVYYPRAGTVSRRKQLIALPPRLVDAGAPTATGNRAKLHALVLALETALKVKSEFYSDPFFRVYININSDYVTKSMMQYRFKWQQNGWLNNRGNPIANRDLMEKAIQLEQKIEEHGSVTYHTFDVSDTYTAKELANTGCDTAQDLYDTARRNPYRSFTRRKLYHLTEDSD